MILTEKETNQYRILKEIGEPIKIEFKNLEPIGNGSYYLKSLISKFEKYENIKTDSRCNFQKYTNGLLLRINHSNKVSSIPIPRDKINEIKLIRGKEKINPIPLSPMWILLRFGVPILIARKFKIHYSEYSIEYWSLVINTRNFKIELISNGYKYEKQIKFFHNREYSKYIKNDSL